MVFQNLFFVEFLRYIFKLRPRPGKEPELLDLGTLAALALVEVCLVLWPRKSVFETNIRRAEYSWFTRCAQITFDGWPLFSEGDNRNSVSSSEGCKVDA
ncbi:hypothetical protein NPIL_628351 [Nephila pilipes]|uniref:Uncharacterized protein n=1 Tax=Nephila pilipes TaxID=299642 RepID=A0A8X6UPJ1_NEPPI|nr:hypothetical protein NPIL_628351 [Nephila pilipes]